MAAFLRIWGSPCLLLLPFVLILSLNLTCAHDAHRAQDHDHAGHEHDHDHHHHHAGHANEEGIFPGHGKADLDSGVWLMAMGSTLIVSLASFVGLALLPICYGLFGSRGAQEPPEWVLEGMTAFSAAAMLTDAFLHQLPHALATNDHHHHNSGSGLAVIAAIVLFFLLDKGMRASAGAGHGHSHGSRQQQQQNKAAGAADGIVKASGEHHAANGSLRKRTAGGERAGHQGSGGGTSAAKQESEEAEQPFLVEEETAARRRAMAYLNLAADAVHNFTDGMAIGAAFLRGGSALGWGRTIIILAHELPQEIGDYGMLVGSGMTTAKALACNFASALSALLGTALVLATGGGASALAENHTSLVEAFTAGGFIYISVGGVFAEMAAKGGARATARQLLCMVAGVLLCASLHGDDHSH